MAKQITSAPKEQLYAVYIQSNDRIYHINKDCAGEGCITINSKIAKCQARKPCETCSIGHQAYEAPIIEVVDIQPVQEEAVELPEQMAPTPSPVTDIASSPEPLMPQTMAAPVEMSEIASPQEHIAQLTTEQDEPIPLSMTNILSTFEPLTSQAAQNIEPTPLSAPNNFSTPEPLSENIISQAIPKTEPIKAESHEKNSSTESGATIPAKINPSKSENRLSINNLDKTTIIGIGVVAITLIIIVLSFIIF